MMRLLRWFVRATKPAVWRMAQAYDLRVDWHCVADGQNPLIIEDDAQARRQHIPKSVYFNTRSGRIRVGANTVFGVNVMVLTGRHLNVADAAQQQVPLHHVPERGYDVDIGRGCYIGSGAIVIGPVKVGDYAVIGAGAVATTDVPPRTFAVGVPARAVLSF